MRSNNNTHNHFEDTFGRLDERRILFFLGQVHHYRKLAPLLDVFEQLGANLICSTTQNLNFGCDFKGDFEVPLRQEGKDVLFLPEQFEMEIATDLIKNYRAQEKKISSAVREAPDWSERLAVASIRLRTMLSIEHDLLVSRLLDSVEPELVVVLHEYNWWTRPLCAQAISRRIPVLSSLRGLPYHHIAGKYDSRFSSRVWLWGKSQYNKLIADGSEPDKLVITGPIHLDVLRQEYRGKESDLRREMGLPDNKRILLLIMPKIQSIPVGKEMLNSLSKFVESRDDYLLVIKWHPYQRPDEIDDLKPESKDNMYFQYEDVYKLMASCDIGLCSGSSAGAELLAFDKPLVEINWRGKNINISYAKSGVAAEVVSDKDWSVIDSLLEGGLSEEQQDAVSKFIADNFYKFDGKCTERVLKEAISLLS